MMKKNKTPQARDFPFTLRPLLASDGGGYWVEFPDLPGCVSDGATLEEAVKNGMDAARSWLKTAQQHGDPIPQPQKINLEYSGKWVQRVPKFLHRILAERAQREGVSLNQFATSLLSQGVGQGHFA